MRMESPQKRWRKACAQRNTPVGGEDDFAQMFMSCTKQVTIFCWVDKYIIRDNIFFNNETMTTDMQDECKIFSSTVVGQ